MTQTTNVQLTKNDGAEEFNLKCEAVEVNLGNSLIARAILSAAGDLVGSDPVLNTETYQLIGVSIADVDDTDFPEGRVPTTVDESGNTLTIPDSDNEQQMEAALRAASKEWGPDASDGFDQLKWNDQSLSMTITSYSATEHASQPKPGVYTVNMELTHIDVYVG